jgi:6-phosphogluconate dehydrogenase (decarboxylating)
MAGNPVKVGIVGLGRWAKVLTRAAAHSTALKIVAGYSRSEEKRSAFQREVGVDAAASLDALLANTFTPRSLSPARSKTGWKLLPWNKNTGSLLRLATAPA